jgi:signal transduction histidine kinase
VGQSIKRVSDLVKAIKIYSYMDSTPLQEIDMYEGLESTLTILGHKLKGIREGTIMVKRDYDDNLPQISGYGSELNHVWTNIIDNAIDALKGKGDNNSDHNIIWLRTKRDNNHYIVVEIADNGPDISQEMQSHMFKPFFTTKDVDKGTGLGLSIIYRIIVNIYHGDMRFESNPGYTQFYTN